MSNGRPKDETAAGRDPAARAEAASAGLVIQTLVKADRGFTMYLPNNPLHEKFFEELSRRLGEHLEEFGPLQLVVSRDQLLCCGEKIYSNPESRENIAFRMHADGIRALTIAEGIEPEELRELVEILGRPSTEVDEDDIVTRLWSAGLPHVSYTLAEAPLPDAESSLSLSGTRAAQEGAFRRYAAELAAAPPAPLLPPPAQQVFTLTETDLAALQELLALEEQRTPHEDMVSIVEAVLAAEEDSGLLEEFLEIVARLCGDLVLTGHVDEAVALLSVLTRVAARPGLPAGHGPRIDGARGRVITPDVLDGLARLLAAGDGIERASLHALVLGLGCTAVEPFCRILGEVPGKETRKALIEALAATGRESPELFLPFLADPRWYLVRNTIYILRRIGSPEAARAVLRCAAHQDARVRKEVLLYLDETADPTGEPVLLGFLGDEAQPLRVGATRSLGRRGSRAAAERLLALVASPEFEERELAEREAVWETLGALSPGRTLPLLERLLLKRRWFAKAKELEDTACAVAGLRRIGSPAALELLRQAAGRKQGEARELLEKALRAPVRGRDAVVRADAVTGEADGG